jgi:hypothetical protein
VVGTQGEKLMDDAGQRIRELKGSIQEFPQGYHAPIYPEQAYEDMQSHGMRCKRRNQRGECASPDARLFGEFGPMSWREYDELKAQGKDPYEESSRRYGPLHYMDYQARNHMPGSQSR